MRTMYKGAIAVASGGESTRIRLPGLTISADDSGNSRVTMPGLDIETDVSGGAQVTMPGIYVEAFDSGDSRVVIDEVEQGQSGAPGGGLANLLRRLGLVASGVTDRRSLIERSGSAQAAGPAKLTVNTDLCDIQVAAAAGRSEIAAELVIKASAEASRLLDGRDLINLTRAGDSFMLSANLAFGDGAGQAQSLDAVLIISLPEACTDLTITTGLGDIAVTGTKSALDLYAATGDITVDR